MSYTFKTGKYSGKSVEQVALTDYNHLKKILFYKNGNKDNLTKSIDDVVNKLNNFIPKTKCTICENHADYFPVELIVGEKYNEFKGTYIGPKEVKIDLNDCRCKEHSRNLLNKNASLCEIKFDILENFSREPEWVRERINNALLNLAGFNGYAKTKKNCEKFIDNLGKSCSDEKKAIKEIRGGIYRQLSLF